MALVWVTEWQIECCGEPFAVGDHVCWTVRAPDVDWQRAALGAEISSAITHSVERHADDLDEVSQLTGTVVAIKRAWGEFAQRNPDDHVHYPVPGSQRFLDVPTSDGTEEHAFPELTFNGWVVELDLEA
ncbi:DUF6578 domain-containing protein [Nocardioides albus]|nr:DUF6578 domain-containing protein [Nocardioides albus]